MQIKLELDNHKIIILEYSLVGTDYILDHIKNYNGEYYTLSFARQGNGFSKETNTLMKDVDIIKGTYCFCKELNMLFPYYLAFKENNS